MYVRWCMSRGGSMTREVALPVVVKARIGCHDEGAVTCVMLPLYLSLLSSQRCLRRQNAHSQRGHPGRTVGRTVARRAGTRTFNVQDVRGCTVARIKPRRGGGGGGQRNHERDVCTAIDGTRSRSDCLASSYHLYIKSEHEEGADFKLLISGVLESTVWYKVCFSAKTNRKLLISGQSESTIWYKTNRWSAHSSSPGQL